MVGAHTVDISLMHTTFQLQSIQNGVILIEMSYALKKYRLYVHHDDENPGDVASFIPLASQKGVAINNYVLLNDSIPGASEW